MENQPSRIPYQPSILDMTRHKKKKKRMIQFEATKHIPEQKRRKIVAVTPKPYVPEFIATRLVEDPDIPLLPKTPFHPLIILIAFILGLFHLLNSISNNCKKKVKKFKG